MARCKRHFRAHGARVPLAIDREATRDAHGEHVRFYAGLGLLDFEVGAPRAPGMGFEMAASFGVQIHSRIRDISMKASSNPIPGAPAFFIRQPHKRAKHATMRPCAQSAKRAATENPPAKTRIADGRADERCPQRGDNAAKQGSRASVGRREVGANASNPWLSQDWGTKGGLTEIRGRNKRTE